VSSPAGICTDHATEFDLFLRTEFRHQLLFHLAHIRAQAAVESPSFGRQFELQAASILGVGAARDPASCDQPLERGAGRHLVEAAEIRDLLGRGAGRRRDAHHDAPIHQRHLVPDLVFVVGAHDQIHHDGEPQSETEIGVVEPLRQPRLLALCLVIAEIAVRDGVRLRSSGLNDVLLRLAP
jgi:hypothetical protein